MLSAKLAFTGAWTEKKEAFSNQQRPAKSKRRLSSSTLSRRAQADVGHPVHSCGCPGSAVTHVLMLDPTTDRADSHPHAPCACEDG
jgi:hypothetical protein